MTTSNTILAKYWILANDASKLTGWKAETIFTQWRWETAHFTSNNLKNNNNVAGQTWYEGCGYPKGTKRPTAEGGWYIKYPNIVDGYVSFINKNQRRYGTVKKGATVEIQIDLIAKGGWAADPNYAKGLKQLHAKNIKDGVYNLPRTKVVVKPKPKVYTSVVDYLKDHGKSYDFVSRRKLAEKYGIPHYSGTADENIKLLKKLQG